MNLIKNYKNKKLFIMFFISYIMLVIITIVIGSVSYISTLNTVRKSIEDNNLAMVYQTKTIIDEKLATVEKDTINLSFNSLVGRISNMQEVHDSEAIFTAYKLITQMKEIKNNNGLIKDIYVFFAKPNIVISHEGMFEPKNFYQDLPYKYFTFDKWTSLYKIDAYRGYNPIATYKNDSNDLKIITFQQSLGFYETVNPLGSIVVVLDKTYLENILGNTNLHGNGTVMVYNKENELMSAVGQENYNIEIDHQKLNVQAIYETNDKNNKLIVNKVESPSTGWKYITIVPRTAYYKSAAGVKRVVLVITFIQIIFGILIALFMSWRNYEPIRRSFNKIKDIFGYGEEVPESEYFNVVEEITSSTLKENAEIKNNLIKLQPVLKNELLNQIIRGSSFEYQEMKNNLRSVGIEFRTNKYGVCKIHIDDCSKFTQGTSIQEIALARLVVANVIEELIEKKFEAYSLDLDMENLAVLFNYNNPEDKLKDNEKAEEIYFKLISCIREAQKVVGENFSILISVGVSNIHENIESISLAFKEAEEALNYNMVKGPGSFIQFKEIDQVESSYIYDIQTEMQLINYIKTGDIVNVEALLNEVYSKNFGSGNQSLDMARCIFYDMTSTIIKVMDELHIDKESVLKNTKDANMLNELLKCKNVQQMYLKLKDISSLLCSYINSNKKSHSVEMKEKIQKFILEHYDKNYISLVWVAEELDLNSTYLSYLFKEQMGETFVNYITRLRIAKGKRLLEETDSPLQKIAEDVGYTNSGVFIKAFKKFEGCTPGKYREATALNSKL